MKTLIIGLFILIGAHWSGAQTTKQEILDLSLAKWQWMADKDADKLDALFHEKSVFVHMGGSWGKE
ncbi:MAG: hypothetical protein RIC35_24325 [Marinoscillum sp.]